jgi:hypothetical protein
MSEIRKIAAFLVADGIGYSWLAGGGRRPHAGAALAMRTARLNSSGGNPPGSQDPKLQLEPHRFGWSRSLVAFLALS